jgi:hypothetical protein
MSVRLIWGRRALERWTRGTPDPSHTISAPNIQQVYQGFVQQLKAGTPWALVGADDAVIHSGTAGVPVEGIWL